MKPGKNRAARFALGKTARTWIAGGIALALVSTIAVIASGYDAREAPRAEPGVWVSRDAGQYARVNTDTGELDIVRKVLEPSGLVQAGGRGVLFSHGNGRAWPIDPANPIDFGDDAPVGDAATDEAAGADEATPASNTEEAGSLAVRMPEGTRDVFAAGRFVAVRTEAGEVFVGELADGEDAAAGESIGDGSVSQAQVADLESRLTALTQVDPLADVKADEAAENEAPGEEAVGYLANAIAIADDGELVMYSAAEGSMRRFNAATGEFVGGAKALPNAAKSAEAPQLALTPGGWAMLDAERGRLWREGESELTLEFEGVAKLQESSDDRAGRAKSVVIADAAGLWEVRESGAPRRIAEAEGTPVQPIEVDGEMYAAWLGQSGGTLWRGEDTVALQFDDSMRNSGELDPVIRSNGERAVLTEVQTGMLWTLPDGAMIPLSQWSISDPPKEDRGTVVVNEVTEQIAPTAMDDAFGVRAGEPAPLSILLNDFDANKRDVLTVVPESLGETPLPEAFGALQLLPGGQQLVVQPAEGASGTATFRYRVTDGTLTSEPATVTLTVVGDETNTGPEWCPVEGCQREWRVPAIAPGGTLVYPVLDDWVDLEGDVMMLASVEVVRSEDPVRAIVTSDGRLAVRHTDANAGAAEVPLRITVRDGRGEERQRELQLSIQADATAEFASTAANVKVGESVVLNPMLRLAGGSGSFALVDATVQSGSDQLRVTPQTGSGTVELEASAPGTTTVSLALKDTMTGSEITGLLRVTATPANESLALPPLRAFVRPLSDSTVEVLDAIPGAGTRALSVTNATVIDGELRADVIEHSRVRVAGNTADGGPGRIGAVEVTVAEGSSVGQGRLTVFQVPESGTSGAIAVADAATVRAGSIVDIRVLDNDVSAPGERLLLHPEVSGSGTKGELAFASGSVLRYLAPQTPGTYRLGYTTYGASSPEASDVGAVLVTVLPKGSNRDPQPRVLTARVAPGEQTEVRVPLSGVDPDGDRIRLSGVASPEDAQLTTSLAPQGAAITVAASVAASPGLHEIEYTVRDDAGAKGMGKLRVIVTDASAGAGAPIAATDYVRLVPGTTDPAIVLPLENDIDPALGKLSIVSVEPNVAGGKDSPEYQRVAERIDLSQMKQGRVALTSDDTLGTVSYRYVVRSSATKSTADGLIVVQTSERVGAQAPTVSDTVLNVRDRGLLSSTGVDVISDKVRWSTGDASTLTLALWGASADKYRVEGDRIVGEYNPKGDLVVFRLSGTDATGSEVSTYGFLIVPPLDELRLTLKQGLKPLSVDEDTTVDARLSELVDLGPGDRAEFRQGNFSVGRAQATCAANSAEALKYSAGKEAPWSDTCLIDVRLVGQDSWTSLPVPVLIVPKAPAVQLNQLSRTVAPGETATIELADMVDWQGGRAGDLSKLRFEVSGGGSLFAIKPGGASVTVDARADAVPGSQEILSIAVSGAGESRAPLMLRVGEAPRDVPRGGTVALRCTVGGSCSTTVVGVGGEHDPFAGKAGGGLKLESVRGDSCQVGSFSRVGDSGVAVSWPGGRITGGTCTVSFTVRDAQGRTGEGSIEFDAQGLPEAPASISQSSFSENSATFDVSLGGQQAHPAVTGVTLSGAGSTSCEPVGPAMYKCVATGLENGSKASFSARAVNAVGQSAPSTAVTAWAYRPPKAPTVTAVPLENPDNTDQGRGGITVTVAAGSSDTSAYKLTIGGTEVAAPGGADFTQEYAGLPVGQLTVAAIPITSLEVPNIGGGGSPTGNPGTATVQVFGAPLLTGATLVSVPPTSGLAAAVGGSNRPGENRVLTYGIARGAFGNPSCDSSNPQFDSLQARWRYSAKVCIASQYGKSEAVSPKVRIGGDLGAPTVNYTISQGATSDGGNGFVYQQVGDPTVSGQVTGFALVYSNSGSDVLNVSGQEDLAEIRVKQCAEDDCSSESVVAWNNAPRVVTVKPNGVCVTPDMTGNQLRAVLAVSGLTVDNANVVVAAPPAAGVTTVSLTVSWSGLQGLNLTPVTLNTCYTPPVAPPVTPPTTP